ncbi:MAG: GDSL-type esterase/lipase family protein [Caldilineales bacterium]
MSSSSPWRKIITGVLVATFSILFSLLLLEGGVRLLRLAPPNEGTGWFWRVPDPATGWSLQPGATGRWFNPQMEYNVDVAINDDGLRDAPRATLDKPAGVTRILLLGDSYVEGLRVPLEQTFGKVLEAQLNVDAPAGRRFEVVNAGVSGWGTDQELLWLRQHGAAYAPDLVLLAFFPGNDFENNSEVLEVENMGRVQKPFFHLNGGELALSYFPFDPAAVPEPATDEQASGAAASASGLSPAASWLKEHSALYRFAGPALAGGAPDFARSLAARGLLERSLVRSEVGGDTIPVAYGVYRVPLSDDWTNSVALTGALVGEMRDQAATLGAPLAAVVVTAPEQVYPDRWQKRLDDTPAMANHTWDLNQPNQLAAQIFEQAGVPFLDLLPTFRAHAEQGDQLHLRQDGHWTPAGERLAGEATAEFLVEQGMLSDQ